jgi:hypothetical protein
MEVVAVDEIRQALINGRGQLPRLGAVRAGTTATLPFVVVDERGEAIESFSAFLRDLILTDMSPLTARSYGNDLLRWWRLLQVLDVEWDRASRSEVEVLVGWMRSADNLQRRRRPASSTTAGSVNRRTGKRALRRGYAPATINHALSVLSSFYAFHAQFGLGPVINPVPASATRRARLAHRSPIDPQAEHRRAPLRQKPAVLMRTRYDKHEHVTSEPQPFLFQRTIGQRTEVITPGALREMLFRLCASLAEQHPQLASIRFTPHDFRRLVRHRPGQPRTAQPHRRRPARPPQHPDLPQLRRRVPRRRHRPLPSPPSQPARRPPSRRIPPLTDDEWAEFEQHFDKHKVELGQCGRHTPPRANTNTPASAAPCCASTPR